MKKLASALLIASSLLVTSAFATPTQFSCPSVQQVNSHLKQGSFYVNSFKFSTNNGENIKGVSSFSSAEVFPGVFQSALCRYTTGSTLLTLEISATGVDSVGANWKGNNCSSTKASNCQMTGTPFAS